MSAEVGNRFRGQELRRVLQALDDKLLPGPTRDVTRRS